MVSTLKRPLLNKIHGRVRVALVGPDILTPAPVEQIGMNCIDRNQHNSNRQDDAQGVECQDLIVVDEPTDHHGEAVAAYSGVN